MRLYQASEVSEVTVQGRRLVPILIVMAMAASLAIAQQQQQVKKIQNATITAPAMEYDWDNNYVQFSGGTKLVLTGAYEATLTSATMTVKLTGKPDRVDSVTADGGVALTMNTTDYDATMNAPKMLVKLTGQSAENGRVDSVIADGPVAFTAITKKTEKSPARKIVATSKDQATYSNDTKLVKLIGGATADVTPLEEGVVGDVIHFTGQTINANLKTRKLTVDNANLTVNTTVE